MKRCAYCDGIGGLFSLSTRIRRRSPCALVLVNSRAPVFRAPSLLWGELFRNGACVSPPRFVCLRFPPRKRARHTQFPARQ